MTRTRQQHEPTSQCGAVHCYSCMRDEPFRGYLLCPECLHMYRTRVHLALARIKAMTPIYSADLFRSSFYPTGLRHRIGAFIWLTRTLFRRPSRIRVCPHCSHDL